MGSSVNMRLPCLKVSSQTFANLNMRYQEIADNGRRGRQHTEKS